MIIWAFNVSDTILLCIKYISLQHYYSNHVQYLLQFLNQNRSSSSIHCTRTMMTPRHGNTSRITSSLWGESIDDWISPYKEHIVRIFGFFVVSLNKCWTWWRHQMETFSALLAIVRGIPVNSPHKGQWRGALMFSLISARINGWVNNREAGDLRRILPHYDVTVMTKPMIWHPRSMPKVTPFI